MPRKKITNLAALIDEAEVTPTQVAAEAGITTNGIRRYITGERTNPGLSIALPIQKMLSMKLGRELAIRDIFPE